MTAEFGFWGSGGGSEQCPVPVVDPIDLRKAWDVFQDVQVRRPGEQVAICLTSFERVCSHGADIGAVTYRAAMLQSLCKHLELISARLGDAKLADGVFDLAATFPMEYICDGMVHQGFPLDVQEFIRHIEKETQK